MAAPTVVGTAQWDTGGTSQTAHKAQMPNVAINAGDLILVFYAKASASGTGTPDAKWTRQADVGVAGAYGAAVFYAIAAGTEQNQLLALTTVAGNRGGSITIVLRGWSSAGGAPFVSSWDQPGTNTATANPPQVAPGIQSQDEMLLVWSVQAVAAATWTLPTNYANRLSDPGSGVGGISYAMGRRTATVSSEDPASSNWSASASSPDSITIAVPGTPLVVAAAGAITPSGADTLKVKKALAGAISTITGALTPLRKAFLSASGGLTPAGALTRKARTNYAGAISTITGALTRNAKLAGLGGSITPAGALTRKAKLAALAGAIGSSGALSAGHKLFASFAGAITPSGVLTIARRIAPLPPSLAQVLRGHHRPAVRLLFLAEDLETVLHEVPGKLVGGTVTLDRSRDVHRAGDVQLANDDGLYNAASSAGLVWPDRIVRVERGAWIGSSPLYQALITGPISTPAESTESGIVSFKIWSRLQRANRPFPGPLALANGTRVRDAIRTMAELGGLGSADAFYDLEDGGATIAAARSYDSDAKILQAMIKLAFDAGLDLYDTGAGVTVLRPFADPTTSEPIWTFAPGVDSTLTSLRRELRDSGDAVYNRAVATGIGPDRYPIRAEARVTNPHDPLFWTPDNDRPRPTYSSPDITTQQMANAVAQRLLIEGALFQEAIAAAAVANPLIEDRAVVHFTGRDVDDDYLLDQVTIPIGPGTMSMATRKIRSLLE